MLQTGTIQSANDNMFKKAFFISLLAMLGILLFTGYDVAPGYDEMTMNEYAKNNVSYYLSGGKDTSFMNPSLGDGSKVPPMVKYYGSAFDYIANAVTSLTGNSDGYEYNVRHIMLQLTAVIGLFFTGMFARRIRNYKAALFSIWLMFLTPIFLGHALQNPKDIPFLTGYIASLYFMYLFLEELPRPTWKTTLWLGLALWFVLSIRIGAILLFFYMGVMLFLYWQKDKTMMKEVKNWGLKLVAACGGAFLLMILFWPFLLTNPSENIMATINVIKNFPQRIPLTFEGEYIDSLTIPKSFLVKSFMITVPVIVIIAIVVAIVYIFANWKQQHKKAILLLMLAAFFPLFYAMYTNAPVYNNWRHFLFIYAPLMTLTGVGLNELQERLKKPALQWAVAGVCAAGLIPVVAWCAQNSPYYYSYYNEVAGGFKKAYYEYEVDYWQLTPKAGIDWLFENEHLADSKDTVVLATNDFSFAYYYVKKRYPGAKVKVTSVGVRSNFAAYWDYAVFNVMFLTPDFLENSFPHPKTIHTIDIDELPVTAVIKDRNRYDFRGFMAFNQSDYKTADSFFQLYLKDINFMANPTRNVSPVMAMAAYTRLVVAGDVSTGYKLAETSVRAQPQDFLSNLTMGMALLGNRDANGARTYLMRANQINPNDSYTIELLRRLGQ